MSVQLNFRQIEDVSIVDVEGRITLGDGSSTLRAALRELGSKGQRKILLNLGGLVMIDSSGLGELVSAFATLSSQGGRFKLMHVTSRVKDLLLLTKLLTIFEVFDDEQAALASFASVPGSSAVSA